MREILWILGAVWIAPMVLSAADFLNVGHGARAVGLGEAYVSLAEGPESSHWNPAGLARVARPSVLLQGAPQAQGHVNDLGMAWPAGDRGGWGTSLRVAGAGEVNNTDEAGNDLGTFEPRAMALFVGGGRTMFANREEGAAWGVGAQYVRSTLVDTAETMTFNAGLLSPYFSSGRGRAGVAYSNGVRLTYDQESGPSPSLWRAGASYRLKEFWLITADAGLPRVERSFLGVGTEFRIAAPGGFTFFERVGYNTRWRDGLGGPAGLSFGLGAQRGRLAIDYAFRCQGGWDAHVLTLSMSWGSAGQSTQVKRLIRDGHRLISDNRTYEAILQFNEALRLDPSNEEALDALHRAAETLRRSP